jgi:hypothetical protein
MDDSSTSIKPGGTTGMTLRRQIWKNGLIHLPACLLMFAVTLGTSWPLWTDMNGWMISLADPQLNAYLLGWSQFALFSQISAFFHANIFWPWEFTLAYGEHLLVQAVLALPFRPFFNTAAVHGISWIQGYFFSALAAYALAWSIWNRCDVAVMAGLIYGFAPYRMAQWEHIQLIHAEFLPLIILAFERIMKGGGRAWQVLLCLGGMGQWLGSWYWTVFSFWFLMPYFLVRLFQQRKDLNRRIWGRFLCPLLIAAVPVMLMALPYFDLMKSGIMIRPRALATDWWARPVDFMVSHERSILFGRGVDFQDRLRSVIDFERYLFPGLSVMAGLIMVTCSSVCRRLPTRSIEPGAVDVGSSSCIPWKPGLWAGLAIFMVLLCFGPEFQMKPSAGSSSLMNPFYMLVDQLPGTDQIRVTARWILPALLSFALLLGYTWYSLLTLRSRHLRRLLQGSLVLLLFLDVCCRPLQPVAVKSRRPEVYRWLEEQPYPSPILLIPIDHIELMLESAWHHQPVVNGSNGYFPPGYSKYMETLAGFPSPKAMDILASFNVRYVVIDLPQSPMNGSQWLDTLNGFTEEKKLNPFILKEIGDYLVVDIKPEGVDIRREFSTEAALGPSL